jgi:hypothetical protein
MYVTGLALGVLYIRQVGAGLFVLLASLSVFEPVLVLLAIGQGSAFKGGGLL